MHKSITIIALISFLGCSAPKSNESVETLNSNTDTLQEVAMKSWKFFCEQPEGNKIIEINDKQYIFSYCPEKIDETDWFRFLLLEILESGGYNNIQVEMRSELSGISDYAGYPVFEVVGFEGVDVNKDGQEELLVTINISGQASGSASDGGAFYDENVYEVYESDGSTFKYSKNLTNQYITNTSTENFANEVDLNIYKIMEKLEGNYVEAQVAEGELLYGKCGGVGLTIGKFNDDKMYSLEFQLAMDSYQVKIEDVVLDEANGNYIIFCKGNEYVKRFDIEVWQDNALTLEFTDGRYYIAERDKDKFAKNNEPCDEITESEGEGVEIEEIMKFESVGFVSGELYISMVGMEQDEYYGFAGIEIEGFEMNNNSYFEEDPENEGVMIQYRLKEGVKDQWYTVKFVERPVDIGNEEPEMMYFIQGIEEFKQ